MSTDRTPFEVFLSYARLDNVPQGKAPTPARGWVTAVRDHILADHRRFSTEPLRIFFDTEEIRDMDDWRHRILGALRSSKILLIFLSPNYFASEPCRWEWEEYRRRQVHQLMGSESIAGVYFAEVPVSLEKEGRVEFNRWVTAIKPRFDEITRGNFTDIRTWFPEGAGAELNEDVTRRLASLSGSLWERIERARRAERAPGNLRRRNPFFVGRQNDLRRLHELVAKGAIGSVVAVHGLGGQGKTELAVAYAHGWADCYPAGLWALGAEGKRDLLSLIGELAYVPEFARDPQLPFTPDEAERNDPVLLGRSVLAHLQRRSMALKSHDPDGAAPSIILLDNVSDAALLSPVQLANLPAGADWFRIVATTRLGPERLSGSEKSLVLFGLDSLAEDDALALVREHQPPRDEDGQIPAFASALEETAARTLVHELGGFTLAIEQVAIFLGLHPEIAPTAFLAGLRRKGLPSIDALPVRDADVAMQMFTQNKQLGLILDATIAALDPAARTALECAALLPPDIVPWPWLQAIATARHPQLAAHAEDEPDPWAQTRRRLSGLRLLTPADQPQFARIHRLVAAHLLGSIGSALDQLSLQVREHVTSRAWAIHASRETPESWELDAVAGALPRILESESSPVSELRGAANAAVFVSDKLRVYRGLSTAGALLACARRVLEQLAAADPADLARQRDLAVSQVKTGDLLVAQGSVSGALELFLKSLAIRERLAAAAPANVEWQCDLALGHSKLGNVLMAQGHLQRAGEEYLADLAIMERLVASDATNPRGLRDLSASYNNVGDVLMAQENLPGALAAYESSLAIRERLAAAQPENLRSQRDLSVTYSKIGQVLLLQGNLPGALAAYQADMAIAARLAAANPGNAASQHDLAVSHCTVGDILIEQGPEKVPAALQAYESSLSIRKKLAESDEGNAEWQRELSVCHYRIGKALEAQGNLADALAAYQADLTIAERLAAADPANMQWQNELALSHEHVAAVLEEQENLPGALAAYQASLRIREQLAAGEGSHRNVSVIHERIGNLLVAQGKLADAQTAYEVSLEIRGRLAAAKPGNAAAQRDLVLASLKLGQLEDHRGDRRRAILYYGRCLALLHGMIRGGTRLDPAMAELLGQLEEAGIEPVDQQ